MNLYCMYCARVHVCNIIYNKYCFACFSMGMLAKLCYQSYPCCILYIKLHTCARTQ